MANARLSSGLEEKPLGLQHPIFELLERDLVLGVVLVHEVRDDRVELPARCRPGVTMDGSARSSQGEGGTGVPHD